MVVNKYSHITTTTQMQYEAVFNKWGMSLGNNNVNIMAEVSMTRVTPIMFFLCAGSFVLNAVGRMTSENTTIDIVLSNEADSTCCAREAFDSCKIAMQ